MSDYNAADNSAKSYALAIDAMREKLESYHRVQIGDCTLYLGDCREILPLLPKVDAVVTDIPYEISQESNGLREINFGAWDGHGSSDVAYTAMELCAHIPSVLVFSAWWQITPLYEIFAGRSARLVAWVKTNPTVMNGQHLFLPGIDTAYYGKLPGAWFGGNCESSVWRGTSPVDREHPTQKPIDLFKWCVLNTVAPSAICLDPFMGSGTTGVACVKLGRKFIGIEIEPKYFEIACKRIQAAYDQPDMLVELEKKRSPEVQEGLPL